VFWLFLVDAVAVQADANEMQAKHGANVPVALLGDEPNEANIAQALHALQVSDETRRKRAQDGHAATGGRPGAKAHSLPHRPHAVPAFHHLSLPPSKHSVRPVHTQGALKQGSFEDKPVLLMFFRI
jgi:hypothetical protein